MNAAFRPALEARGPQVRALRVHTLCSGTGAPVLAMSEQTSASIAKGGQSARIRSLQLRLQTFQIRKQQVAKAYLLILVESLKEKEHAVM